MTITTLDRPPDLTAATDDEFAAMLADPELIEAACAEAGRRNTPKSCVIRPDTAQARARAARRKAAEPWRELAYAQFIRAESDCRGVLLNRRGLAAGIDPWSLWSGTDARVNAYASWELAEWFAMPGNARVTVTAFHRQQRNQEATYRDQLERDDASRIRQDASRGPQGARVHSERAGDDVPAPHAGDRGEAGGRGAGSDGHGRHARAAGRGTMTATATRRRSPAVAALHRRAAELREASPAAPSVTESDDDSTSGVIMPPEPEKSSQAAVAVRAPGTAVAVREPIDGDQLLRDTRKFLRHFALWQSEAQLTTATLATAAMHARDEDGDPIWEYAFKLMYTAADYGAGKSWFAKLTASLTPGGTILLEPTKPSLIDEIAERNTVVVTEVDELFVTPSRNRGLLAVLNASYERGRYHTRKSGGKTQKIHVFGHQIIDGLDSLLSATRGDLRGLISRCIIIRVRMAPDGYRRPRWDKTAQALAARGRDRLAAWAAQLVAAGIAEVVPDLPAGLGTPRRCALYEPLFTFALAADLGDAQGYWSTAMADAAVQLESALDLADDDEDQGTELDRIMASWGDEED